MNITFAQVHARSGADVTKAVPLVHAKFADADFDGKLAFRELPRAQEVADLLDRIRNHGKPYKNGKAKR